VYPGSDNVYAIVDKSSKNVPTTNVGKEEGTCQSDQTYAVVDKARKRNDSWFLFPFCLP
jgi:hypothetical protein